MMLMPHSTSSGTPDNATSCSMSSTHHGRPANPRLRPLPPCACGPARKVASFWSSSSQRCIQADPAANSDDAPVMLRHAPGKPPPFPSVPAAPFLVRSVSAVGSRSSGALTLVPVDWSAGGRWAGPAWLAQVPFESRPEDVFFVTL
jgi:hypothetical protein